MLFEMLTLGLVLQELVNLAGGAIVGNDVEALVVHVEDQVLTLNDDVIRYVMHITNTFKLTRLTMTAKPMRPMSPLYS